MADKREPKQEGLFKGNVPRMPEGYYSGDKPNPNLRAFVEEHLREKPYDQATDDYDVPAFDKPIETTKATAIYNMHTYWSKKPHDAIRQYIRHYTEPGDLVLDPFCGSGGTALAALMEDRKAIAIDRSPAATFITKNYCTPVDVGELQAAFEELKAKVKPEIDWLYETRCDRCGGKATTGYTVYSQVFQCPRCMEKVTLFDCIDAEGQTKAGKSKKIKACPHCAKRGIIEEISTRTEKFGAIPVLVSYICEAGCTPKCSERRHHDDDAKKRDYFQRYDLGKLQEIEGTDIPHWYPDADLRVNIPYRMLYKKDFRPSDAENLVDLFTKRNLWALASIRAAIANTTPSEDNLYHALLFILSGLLYGTSRMSMPGGGYIKPSSKSMVFMSGTYYLPPVSKEHNVMDALCYQAGRVAEGKSLLRDSLSGLQPIVISTGHCTDELANADTSSIDYIITDPPYAGKVQYGELNFLWETWLRLDTSWHSDEIIVNEVRGKTEADWARMMRDALVECYRVLKPGRWISICYHDTSEGTWQLLQDVVAEVGFVASPDERVVSVEKDTKSRNQNVSDKVNKRDLVISFRKPKRGEAAALITIEANENEQTFREKAQTIIRDYLAAHRGATKDRIYDELVSRMVRSGQMEAHDFEALLRQVAEPVRGDGNGERWFLLCSEEERVDESEVALEDAAAASVGEFMHKTLAAHPEATGVHYSDLFEHFVYAVKDKPRRELADWLPDYFFKTDEGTWRLPASEQEYEAKASGRARGINRRVKRYLSYLLQGLPVPERERPTDATIAEWLRHCTRSGIYEQGKLLFELGGLNLGALSEEGAVEADEDYRTCVRMLDREAAAKPAKQQKKSSGQPPQLDL